ncbi:MAG: hypothetical protein ACXVHI_05275 [Frankiaceae bacterium]
MSTQSLGDDQAGIVSATSVKWRERTEVLAALRQSDDNRAKVVSPRRGSPAPDVPVAQIRLGETHTAPRARVPVHCTVYRRAIE